MCSPDGKRLGVGRGSGMAAHRNDVTVEPKGSARSHNRGVTDRRPMKSAHLDREGVSPASGGCDGG